MGGFASSARWHIQDYPPELNSKTVPVPFKKVPNRFVEVRRKKSASAPCTGRKAGAAGHVSARKGALPIKSTSPGEYR